MSRDTGLRAEEEDRRAFETSRSLLTASGSILSLFMIAFAFIYQNSRPEALTKTLLMVASLCLILSAICSVAALLKRKMDAEAINWKNQVNIWSSGFLVAGLAAILAVLVYVSF